MRATTVDDRCRLFFDFFSTSSKFLIFPKKVIGPDASENILDRPGAPGGLLGASGGVQEASWGVQGLSGRGPGGVLGGAWGVLGISGGHLGRVLGALVSPSLPQRTSRNFPRLNLHSFFPTLNLS